MFFVVTASYEKYVTDKIFFSNNVSSIMVFFTKQRRALIPKSFQNPQQDTLDTSTIPRQHLFAQSH